MAIRSPTNWLWLLGRTLVDGDADLPNAHAFQDGWTLSGPELGAPKAYAKRASPWNEYFASAQELMNESPAPVTDARALDAIAPLIRRGGSFDPAKFSPAQTQVGEIQSGIGDAIGVLQQFRGRGLVQNGWTFPLYGLGDFGQDYGYRAAVRRARCLAPSGGDLPAHRSPRWKRL